MNIHARQSAVHNILGKSIGGHGNDGDDFRVGAVHSADGSGGVPAVHTRHHNIHIDHAETAGCGLSKQLYSLLSVGSAGHLHTAVFQHTAGNFHIQLVILYDQRTESLEGNITLYLRRGFDRLYSTAGTLFLDERCRLATPNAAGTANALIYGHNTASGSMFSQLLNYADKAFYTAHPTFRFDTLYEEGTWQVAAVLRTELGADALPYYSFFDASTQEEWQQRVDAILELSLYDTGVVPQYGDQLLTLSTCGVATVTTNSRFAVLAVKIN